MLTEVKAFSSWHSAPTLPLVDGGRAETDLLQIRNIDGLDPVKASVNMSPLGSVDGSSYVGSTVETRNIILTIRPNPDWNEWSFEGLRKLVYSYFMPKRSIKLVFYSTHMVPVEISGIVESIDANMFSKDPEYLVSIICPDPYFTALDPIEFAGTTVQDLTVSTTIPYEGSIEAGIHVEVKSAPGAPSPTTIGIQLGDPKITYFAVDTTVNSSLYFELSSVTLKKFVRSIGLGSGVITNLLNKISVREGSLWPTLESGDNEFIVFTDAGTHTWELKVFERFGGL